MTPADNSQPELRSPQAVLSQLVALSNALGRPELDYVILGEGNTSARIDDDSFWVKASGTELRTITAAGFVQVSFEAALALVDLAVHDPLTGQPKRAGLNPLLIRGVTAFMSRIAKDTPSG